MEGSTAGGSGTLGQGSGSLSAEGIPEPKALAVFSNLGRRTAWEGDTRRGEAEGIQRPSGEKHL